LDELATDLGVAFNAWRLGAPMNSNEHSKPQGTAALIAGVLL